MERAIVIGGGPCGLSAAAELQKQGIKPLIIEKGGIANSIYNYPTFIHFFSTANLLEVGDVPFMTVHERPTRQEALVYYLMVAQRLNMRLQTFENVLSVRKADEHFIVNTETAKGEKLQYEAENVVIATGYYDNPNMLNIAGEDLPKVTHYYKEAHPYHGQKVAIIGGKNSAVRAAIDLEQVGAEITMIYRGAEIPDNVKPWVKPVFDSLVDKGKVKMYWKSHVEEITEHTIVVRSEDGEQQILDNDFVLALTGYHPNHQMLSEAGVQIDPVTKVPAYNQETMETNVTGLYIAGVIAAGTDANAIFIENGRFHGAPIAKHIAEK